MLPNAINNYYSRLMTSMSRSMRNQNGCHGNENIYISFMKKMDSISLLGDNCL